MGRTIYALSTPYAKSGIAIIRVSGIESLKSLKILTKKDNFIPNKATLSNIYVNEEIIDNAIVIYFKAPYSYTGEDLVEYHIHGSLAVIKEMLDALALFNNHYIANRGEFTQIAVENNKLDLITAEGILDLINAETYQQRKQAIRSLNGEVESTYLKWYEELKNILALVEATIDFSDQEIPEDTFTIAFKQIDALVLEIKKELQGSNKINKIKDGITISIVGSPNVGKSSLINYLSNKNVSIVSEIAGTTRDIVETYLDIAGFPVLISDTAGIRETEEIIEKEGIKRAIEKAITSDIKIVIFTPESIVLSNELNVVIDNDTIFVLNKIDLTSNKALDVNFEVCAISLKENIGLDLLKAKIEEKLIAISGLKENSVVLQKRHEEILKETLSNLENSFNKSQDIVLLSYYIRLSLSSLGRIFGNFEIEEILGKIFSNFCVGK